MNLRKGSERAMCLGKHPHRTRVRANRHAAAANWQRRKGERALTAYKCQWCPAYHVGHSRQG